MAAREDSGSRGSVERKPWDRLPEESSRAYAAFMTYLNLGPARSVNKAWRQCKRELYAPSKANVNLEAKNADGTWTLWGTRFSWRERAWAWDDYRAGIEREEIVRRRGREVARFARREVVDRIKRHDLIHGLTEKAASAPVTDIQREEDVATETGEIKRVKTRVRGVNLAGVARLAEVADKISDSIVGGAAEVEIEGGEIRRVKVRLPGGGPDSGKIAERANRALDSLGTGETGPQFIVQVVADKESQGAGADDGAEL